MTKLTTICMLAAALALPVPAQASRITCNGPYQVVGRDQIATPYCADEDLAAQARQWNARIKGEDVRRNPALKERLCRSHDSQSSACASYAN